MRLKKIYEIDALTGEKFNELEQIRIFANSHYVTPGPTLQQAIKQIYIELDQRLKELTTENKLLEAQRLQQRVKFDIENDGRHRQLFGN